MVRRHKLRINITKDPVEDSLVSARSVTIRERVLARLLGRKQRVTVLIPGQQIGSLEIIEPTTDDDLMALADAVGVTGNGGDRR